MSRCNASITSRCHVRRGWENVGLDLAFHVSGGHNCREGGNRQGAPSPSGRSAGQRGAAAGRPGHAGPSPSPYRRQPEWDHRRRQRRHRDVNWSVRLRRLWVHHAGHRHDYARGRLCRHRSNAVLAKTVRTQSNHFFMSIYPACGLELLTVRHDMNHSALRTWIYLGVARYAFDELQKLKAA